MVLHHCIRCEKNIRKNARKVGHTDYIRIFLKVEHGLCDEELDNGHLCHPCRVFIYEVVHTPDRRDPAKAKRASTDSVAAAAAAVHAADQAKKKKEDGPTGPTHYFNINAGRHIFFLMSIQDGGTKSMCHDKNYLFMS